MKAYCKRCLTDLEIESGGPYFIHNDDFYCGDCAFIEGLINEKELMKHFYYFIALDDPGTPIIKNGKVEIVSRAYKNAQKDADYRRTPEYKKWRQAVYKRDDYTCQSCHQRGGKLNAHHIKHFAKFKELRTEIKNGVTLCEQCHKLLHKKENIKCMDG